MLGANNLFVREVGVCVTVKLDIQALHSPVVSASIKDIILNRATLDKFLHIYAYVYCHIFISLNFSGCLMCAEAHLCE